MQTKGSNQTPAPFNHTARRQIPINSNPKHCFRNTPKCYMHSFVTLSPFYAGTRVTPSQECARSKNFSVSIDKEFLRFKIIGHGPLTVTWSGCGDLYRKISLMTIRHSGILERSISHALRIQASLVIRDLTLRVFAITRFREKKP